MSEEPMTLNRVLQKLQEEFHLTPASVKELAGGLTNENYVVTMEEGQRLVIRIPGAGTSEYIDRAAEKQNALAAAKEGLGPRVYLFDEKGGASAVAFLEGRTLHPKDFQEDPETVRMAGRLLLRCHSQKTAFANEFSPLRQIGVYRNILADGYHGKQYETLPAAMEALSRIDAAFSAHPPRLVPCHNDPRADNFMICRDHPYLIDWEYSGMSDGFSDLACVCTENNLSALQEANLLSAYCGGRETDKDRAHLLISRFVIALHWSVWALVQIASGKDAGFYYPYGVDHYKEVDRAMRDPGFLPAIAQLEQYGF
ncbi:MAG: phosphotransferase [Lachnospiraceae bacterium]